MFLAIIPALYRKQIVWAAQQAVAYTFPKKIQYLRPDLAPRHGYGARPCIAPRPPFYLRRGFLFSVMLGGVVAGGVHLNRQHHAMKADESRFYHHLAGPRNVYLNKGYYTFYPNVLQALKREAKTAKPGQISQVLDNAIYVFKPTSDGPCGNRTYVQLTPKRPAVEGYTSFGRLRTDHHIDHCSRL
jgi:hypothetical protein